MGKALAAWLLIAGSVASPVSSPRDVVLNAVSQVMAIVSEPVDADRSTRPDAMERRRVDVHRVASELFDFEDMAKRALSRHWAARTRAEQMQFVEVFTDMLERTYLGRLEAFAGKTITYPTESIDGGYAMVRSRIAGEKRTEASLVYRLRQAGGRWKVFDVTIDGVGFVSTYRSEFDRILKSSSYASLLDRMKAKRLEINALR